MTQFIANGKIPITNHQTDSSFPQKIFPNLLPIFFNFITAAAMEVPRSVQREAEFKDFLKECHRRVDRLQEKLQSHPDASEEMRRKVSQEKLNKRLLSNVEKEQEKLEQASKRLKQEKSRVQEEAQNVSQAVQAAQTQSAIKDYWSYAKIDELNRLLYCERSRAQAEKVRADQLAHKVLLYEGRFGRIF